jgi:hypothetical protein
MLVSRFTKIIRCQRGVVLPMAFLTMLILSALIIAFSMMAASEPLLANNQLQVAQARAVAESGVEKAIWALNNDGNPNGISGGIPAPLVTAPAPYDGTAAVAVMINGVQMGVFTASVTGASSSEQNIVATGWTPTNTGTGPKVKQKIKVTVFKPLFNLNPPPSALTVRGEINASGHALIDSRSDTSCGNKAGSMSKGATTTGGSAAIYGADGNNTSNQSGDMVQNVADTVFDQYTYSNKELNAYKALAKKNGTYYQGTTAFNASNKMPNGIVYIDTVSGNNIDASGPNTTATSDFASVNIDGNAPLDASGIFSGMLIVAGSLTIHGSFQMHGLVYVQNDFTYLGTGAGQITGAVLSQNIRDTSATSIDTDTGGNSTIIWNCDYAKRGGGYLPPTFTIEPGTYKEVSG